MLDRCIRGSELVTWLIGELGIGDLVNPPSADGLVNWLILTEDRWVGLGWCACREGMGFYNLKIGPYEFI